MIVKGNKTLAADWSRLLASKSHPVGPRLKFDEAATEIAHALKINYEAASMTLYGLCATGCVGRVDDQGDIVDEDTCTIADFARKPFHVVASDVRSFLTNWSSDPLSSKRDQVIRALLAEFNPPRKLNWKAFCNRVRDDCNGWVDSRPALGFSDKTIQRLVKDLRAK
jgi:hypothetical protein